MRRRNILKRMGVTTAGIAVIGSTASASKGGNPNEIDIEEAKEMLAEASRKDAKTGPKKHEVGVGGEKRSRTVDADRHVVRTLEKLPEEIRAELAEDHLEADSIVSATDERLQTASSSGSLTAQASSGSDNVYADTFIYYDWPHTDTPVAYWHQEIDYSWNDGELTSVDERYWYSTTTTGKIDQWTQTDEEVRAESGGVGESSYRLMTASEFGMCFGVGPVNQCFNKTELWIDMKVEAGGIVDVDTIASVGTDPQ